MILAYLTSQSHSPCHRATAVFLCGQKIPVRSSASDRAGLRGSRRNLLAIETAGSYASVTSDQSASTAGSVTPSSVRCFRTLLTYSKHEPFVPWAVLTSPARALSVS